MSDDARLTSVSATESEIDDAPDVEETPPSPPHTSGLPIILWATLSIGLLAYVAFGSTPAYIWRFGRKHEELKSILRTWTIEVNNLPRVGHQWLLNGAFYAALIVFLLGAIAGFWLLLGARNDQELTNDPTLAPRPGAATPSSGPRKG